MFRIFILEDDPNRIEWFQKTFEEHIIDITDRSPEACDFLLQNKYDLIFLDRDLGHPKENGEDVSWFMRQNEIAPDTPVFVHTVNPRGQRVMMKDLKTYRDNVYQVPFPSLRKCQLADFIKFLQGDN